MSLLISNCFYLGNFRSKDYHCCAHTSFIFIYSHVSDTLVNLNPSWWSHYHHVAIFSQLVMSLSGKPAAQELTSTAFNDLVALSALGKKTMTNALRHHWRTSLQIWVVLFLVLDSFKTEFQSPSEESNDWEQLEAPALSLALLKENTPNTSYKQNLFCFLNSNNNNNNWKQLVARALFLSFALLKERAKSS